MNQYIGIYRRCELLYIRSEFEKYALQPLEGKILYFLRKGCCTQEDVCIYFDMDKGRIARTLSELEDKGLVCRVVNENNKRQKLVSLTLQGNQVLSEIDRIFEKWDAVCFSGFTEEERRLYQDIVKRIAENAMEYRHNQIIQREGSTYGK